MSLPANFPAKNISSTNRRKLEWFYRRYVEELYPEYTYGHFLLVAYAAVPALLTPDLLYKLWQNFHQYQWVDGTRRIHRIAVSDILLSPLCREVGYELYEMESSLRSALLSWLGALETDEVWAARRIPAVSAIAEFVQEYHQQPNPARQRWGSAYEEIQEWNALSFTQPGQLQQKIWQKLQSAVSQGKETETLRVLDFWSKAATQLGFAKDQEHQEAWQKNAAFAQAWKALLQHNTSTFIAAITSDPAYSRMLDDRAEGGIAVQMPVAVHTEIDSWVQEQQNPQEQRKVLALIVGVNEYLDPDLPPQQGCLNDAREFQALLQYSAEYVDLPLEVVFLQDREATINMVREALKSALAQLQEGDHFVFFFAGNSANALQTDYWQKDGTLYFFDSQQGNTGWSGIRQDEIEDEVIYLIQEKKVNCLLVLDHPQSPERPQSKGYAQSFREVPMYLQGSLIIMYGASSGESSYEQLLGQEMRGVFPYALTSVFREKGINLSFRHIMEQTRLRMTQLVDRQTPVLEAFPTEMADALLLAHEVFTEEKQFDVHFRPESSQFVLAAGARQGITPSLEFMHTLIKLTDGRVLTVDQVYQEYATLRQFTGDGSAEQVFKSTLLQTALPKMQVAFDPAINEQMAAQLRQVIQSYEIHYIDIRSQAAEAQYFIHAWENNYFLARHTSTENLNAGSIKPLFNLEPDPYELIHQMEYIAQWTGVLEYQKMRTQLDRNDLRVVMELFDGQRSGQLREGKAEPSSVVENPVDVSLRDFPRDRSGRITQYSAPPGMDYRSAFRLRLSNEGKSPFYVQLLYLDSTYGIQPLGESMELYPGKGDTLLQVANDPNAIFLVDFPVKMLDLGIRELYDFIKIIISEQPISLAALEQESLELDRAATRTTIYRQQTAKDSFTIGEGDWLSVTIPIRIRYSESTAAETTETPPFSNIGAEKNIDFNTGNIGLGNDPLKQQTAEEPIAFNPEEIKKLISEDDMKQAMVMLQKTNLNAGMRDDVQVLNSRLEALERESARGVISAEDYNLSRNRIRFTLVEIVDQVDRQQRSTETPRAHTKAPAFNAEAFKKLITRGKLQEAIEYARNNLSDPKLTRELPALTTQLTVLRADYMKGAINREEYESQHYRIGYMLLLTLVPLLAAARQGSAATSGPGDLQQLKNLIARDELEPVLDQLLAVATDISREREYLLLSAQYRSLLADEMQGIISPDEVEQSRLHIAAQLLDWVYDLNPTNREYAQSYGYDSNLNPELLYKFTSEKMFREAIDYLLKNDLPWEHEKEVLLLSNKLSNWEKHRVQGTLDAERLDQRTEEIAHQLSQIIEKLNGPALA